MGVTEMVDLKNIFGTPIYVRMPAGKSSHKRLLPHIYGYPIIIMRNTVQN